MFVSSHSLKHFQVASLGIFLVHLPAFVCYSLEISSWSIYHLFFFPPESFILVYLETLVVVSCSPRASTIFSSLFSSVSSPSPEVFLGCFSCCFHTLSINFSHCKCWDFCFRSWVQTVLFVTVIQIKQLFQ